MVDDIDKESAREELYEIIDSLRDKLRILRRLLQEAPDLPEPIALRLLGHLAMFPEDHEVGKRLQQKLGPEAIPYKTECEGGAGLWLRLTGKTVDSFPEGGETQNQERD